jgi:LCP family protein required for cell wall assembly
VGAAPVVRLRRSWPQRFLIGFNLLVIAALLLGASGIGYFWYRFGQLPRLDVGVDEAAGPAFNVLLVGSDTRDVVETPEDAAAFGADQVSGQRADTVIVVRVDPDQKKASLLSIPRDLWVPIAGTDSRNRVNSAFRDGPDQLIATIREALNIEIHHYVQIDFNGFRRIVEIVGGVPVYFPGPARDQYSGLNIPEGGCITLTGDQALGYVRARHYQFHESGRWRSDPTGDHGRIDRQQDFIRRLIRQVAEKSGPLSLGRVNKLAEAAIQNVQIDDELSFNRMMKLARRFRSLNPGEIDMLTIPTRGANIGGASVLLLRDEEAAPILARFRPSIGEGGAAVPSEVRVRVLNGTGRGGEAGRTSAALQIVGFVPGGAGDASSYGHERTTIRFAPGQGAAAALLERYLLAGADLVEDSAVTGVDAVLVTGADYAGVLEQPRPDQAPLPEPATTEPPETPDTTASAPQAADPASQC